MNINLKTTKKIYKRKIFHPYLCAKNSPLLTLHRWLKKKPTEAGHHQTKYDNIHIRLICFTVDYKQKFIFEY